jgi:hydrogenase maturation protease
VKTSLHELDLLVALELIPGGRRPEISILGVEPAEIDYGLELSPAVKAAVPRVVDAVQDLIARLQNA